MKVFHDLTNGVRVTVNDIGQVSEITKYQASNVNIIARWEGITRGNVSIVCDGVTYPIAKDVRAGMGATFPGL